MKAKSLKKKASSPKKMVHEAEQNTHETGVYLTPNTEEETRHFESLGNLMQ